MSGEDRRLVAIFAVLAGVGAAFAGPSPTGQEVVDWILVAASAAAVVWTAASAPWWSSVIAAAVGAALAPNLALIIIGVVAALVGLWIGMVRSSVPLARAWVAAVAIQVLARLGNVWRFGFSAAVAITVLVFLAVLGIVRRPRAERKVIWRVTMVVGGLAVLAIAGFVVAGLAARADLEEGQRLARQGINELKDGDLTSARSSFDRAADLLAEADDALSKPWAVPARLVPVLAQNRKAAADLTESAASMARTATDVLQVVNYDSLRMVNGRIDIAAIQALDAPLARLDVALNNFSRRIDNVHSQWLVGPLGDRLATLGEDVKDQEQRSADVRNIVRHAPAMLGADRPRVYFVAFTTPAEARGLGGFMGNWAELTVTNGRFAMTRFGRTTDLENAQIPGAHLDGPLDFLSVFGGYGFRKADGTVGKQAWHNITMPPDFPTVAQVIAELYPQSGGQAVDGVFAMDAFTIAKLLTLTGPISVVGVAAPLNSQNATDFLLKGQYEQVTDTEARIDMLGEVAGTVVTKLLGTSLPEPRELIDLLAPMAHEGRLLAWSADQDEQQVFERADMTYSMRPPPGNALKVTFDNVGGNKIDAHLSSRLTVADSGAATLTLHNAANGSLPPYVIANQIGKPDASNRLRITVYCSAATATLRVDGQSVESSRWNWHGWTALSEWVDIAAGKTVKLELSCPPESHEPIEVKRPATANPVEVDGAISDRP